LRGGPRARLGAVALLDEKGLVLVIECVPGVEDFGVGAPVGWVVAELVEDVVCGGSDIG